MIPLRLLIAFSVVALVSFLSNVAHGGIIAAYDFEPDAGAATPQFTDRSGNGNHLTTFNTGATPVWGATAGVEGGAYTYDGFDQLVAPVDVRSTSLPNMTWGAWARTDSLAHRQHKVLGADFGAFHRVIGLDTRTGGVPSRYSAFAGENPNGDPNTGAVIQTPTSAQPANTTNWAFIAASYDNNAGTMTFYWDADVSTTNDALNSIVWNTNFRTNSPQTSFVIGAIRPDFISEGFQGSIDNVFVDDETLDLNQLTAFRDGGFNAVLNGGAAVPEPSTFALLGCVLAGFGWRRRRKTERVTTSKPVLTALTMVTVLAMMNGAAQAGIIGYWALDETTGTNAPNLAVGGTAGTLNGNAAWVNDTERGQVVSLNGSTSFVDAGMIPALSSASDFTWSFWGRATSANGLQVALGNRFTNGTNNFIKFTPVQFEYGLFPSQHTTIDYADFRFNEWDHHVVVKDGTSFTYYRNGVAGGTTSSSYATPQMPFYFGADGAGAEYWGGLIDDVAIFDESLTQQQIATIGAGDYSDFGIAAAVPEPSTFALLGCVLAGFGWRRRRVFDSVFE